MIIQVVICHNRSCFTEHCNYYVDITIRLKSVMKMHDRDGTNNNNFYFLPTISAEQLLLNLQTCFKLQEKKKKSLTTVKTCNNKFHNLPPGEISFTHGWILCFRSQRYPQHVFFTPPYCSFSKSLCNMCSDLAVSTYSNSAILNICEYDYS